MIKLNLSIALFLIFFNSEVNAQFIKITEDTIFFDGKSFPEIDRYNFIDSNYFLYNFLDIYGKSYKIKKDKKNKTVIWFHFPRKAITLEGIRLEKTKYIYQQIYGMDLDMMGGEPYERKFIIIDSFLITKETLYTEIMNSSLKKYVKFPTSENYITIFYHRRNVLIRFNPITKKPENIRITF